MSVFSTWAENGFIVTQGRGAGEAAAITGSESGLGQVLDSNWGHHGLVSSLVWGQAAHRSAGLRSEQGPHYYGMKDAEVTGQAHQWGWPHGGGTNVCNGTCLPLWAQLQL